MSQRQRGRAGSAQHRQDARLEAEDRGSRGNREHQRRWQVAIGTTGGNIAALSGNHL
jgi:hypothetical protein